MLQTRTMGHHVNVRLLEAPSGHHSQGESEPQRHERRLRHPDGPAPAGGHRELAAHLQKGASTDYLEQSSDCLKTPDPNPSLFLPHTHTLILIVFSRHVQRENFRHSLNVCFRSQVKASKEMKTSRQGTELPYWLLKPLACSRGSLLPGTTVVMYIICNIMYEKKKSSKCRRHM